MGRDTDHAGFLLAIAADPADSLSRDAYLDWLTERDDPRAEFIRVQEQIAGHAAPRGTCLCGYEPCDGYHHNSPQCPYVRSAELLTTHERDWRGAMVCGRCWGTGRMEKNGSDYRCGDCHGTGYACWPLYQYHLDFDPNGDTGTFQIAVTFRRGLVHTVRAPLDVLLAPGVAETIGHWHPLERVEVTDDAVYTTHSENHFLIRMPFTLTMRDHGVITKKEQGRLLDTIYESPEKVHDDISAVLLNRFRRASAPQ